MCRVSVNFWYCPVLVLINSDLFSLPCVFITWNSQLATIIYSAYCYYAVFSDARCSDLVYTDSNITYSWTAISVQLCFSMWAINENSKPLSIISWKQCLYFVCIYAENYSICLFCDEFSYLLIQVVPCIYFKSVNGDK